jgi:hypothetical protein
VEIQYLDQGRSDYRAGTCNIGPGEIARRRRAGILAILMTLGLGATLVWIDAPQAMRGLVLFPLWGGLISLEQVRRRFCVAFAYAGIRSANPSETRESVSDATDMAADRATARWMVLYCGLLALVITLFFALLPA